MKSNATEKKNKMQSEEEKNKNLVEQIKAIAKAHRKNSAKNIQKRNAILNNSKSENILLKSSPEANIVFSSNENIRQQLPNSTKAAEAKKIVFYELPYSPNPKITRAQLGSFKQFHSTGLMQKMRNSVSSETTGLRGESTKDSNKIKIGLTGTTGSTSGSRKRGKKGGKIQPDIKTELDKLKSKIVVLVNLVNEQGKLLKKMGLNY